MEYANTVPVPVQYREVLYMGSREPAPVTTGTISVPTLPPTKWTSSSQGLPCPSVNALPPQFMPSTRGPGEVMRTSVSCEAATTNSKPLICGFSTREVKPSTAAPSKPTTTPGIVAT